MLNQSQNLIRLQMWQKGKNTNVSVGATLQGLLSLAYSGVSNQLSLISEEWGWDLSLVPSSCPPTPHPINAKQKSLSKRKDDTSSHLYISLRVDLNSQIVWRSFFRNKFTRKTLRNKLAKARKTRKSPGTLDLKRFGPGKLWVKNFRKAYPNPN